ncbi:MAG: acyl-CoA dehydrogenase family protein [Hyphomonas sp.]
MTLHAPVSEFSEEDLSMFRDSVSRFLDSEAPPEKVAEWSAAKVVERDLWRRAGEFGMLGASMPAEYGGLGGDFRHERIILEEMGGRGLEGWGVAVHNTIVAPYIAAFATEAQKQAWLPGIISGDVVLAIGMTEPSGGSDLANLKTRARLDGDEWVIDGQKTFISNGQTADLVIVACRTGEAGAKGVSLIAIPGDAEGFERGRNLDKIGRDSQDTSELFFSGVRVPKENLLGGTPGQSFKQMMQMLPQERLVIAIMGLAMLERALDLTVTYAREREMFGKTLMDQQNTQFTLADIKTQAVVGRAFVDQCADRLLIGELDAVTASMAKLWITETEVSAISRCLQLFGGYG